MSERVIVTKPMIGICHMQVCAVKDAADEELLRVANEKNECGTSRGWCHVIREESETWGDMRPVQCADDPDRLHYILAC